MTSRRKNIATVSRSIGLVVPAFDKGGLEQVVLNLYNNYRALGWRVIILVENNESGYMASLVASPDDVYIFNRDEALFLGKCRSRGIDTLHYHYSTFGLWGAETLGIRCLYTLHNVYTWLSDEDFARRAGDILSAGSVVAVSTLVRDYFCSRGKIDVDRVQIITNGIDTKALTMKRRVTREALKLPAAKPSHTFAVVASFHRNKHHLASIEAAERLFEKGRSDFELVFLGNSGDAAYEQEVRERVKQSQARHLIHFVPYLARETMAATYQEQIDTVVLASIQEGCSNVVLECLALGVPMILTRVGAATEAARLSDSVTLVPAAYEDVLRVTPQTVTELSSAVSSPNAQALADAMESHINQPRSRTPVSATLLDAKAMADAYVEAIERAHTFAAA